MGQVKSKLVVSPVASTVATAMLQRKPMWLEYIVMMGRIREWKTHW